MRADNSTVLIAARRVPVPLLLVALFLLVAQYWIAAGAFVIGGLLTLAGGWLTNRREHASWLRDQRASRYQELVTRANQLQMANISVRAELPGVGDPAAHARSIRVVLDIGETDSFAQAYARAVRAVMDAASAVEVIGPEKVAVAAGGLHKALIQEPLAGSDTVREAEKAFLSAAREALRTQ